ncbi:hypothetical protein [Salinibacter ruber]|uniref:hypothetical protein n=1 Tax=Salinibacter ruber TaxID=146919 RepID=UPI00216A4F59|nr:hypothetical protein [Salinibacter ruber]MCS4049258.1 hypothetical protein [Salinibacter ruber]
MKIRAGAGHELLDRVEPVDVPNFDVEHHSPSFADPVDALQDRRGPPIFDSVPEPTSGPIDAFFEPKKILCDHRQSQASIRICLTGNAAAGVLHNFSGSLLGDMWDLGHRLCSSFDDLLKRWMLLD